MNNTELEYQTTPDLLLLLRAVIENKNSGLDREKEIIICEVIRIMSNRTNLGSLGINNK